MNLDRVPPNCLPEAWACLWAEAADLPDVIFHYTSASAAVSIITGRKMWATDLLFTNDPTEIRYAADVIGIALDGAIAAVGNDVGRRRWLETFRMIANGQVRRNSWYAISFCADGDLLSQWRSYADAGGGFALGFSGASLCGLRGWTVPIDYTRDRQLKLAREVIDIHVQQLASHADVDDETAREDFIRVSNSLMFLLSLLLFRFKHRAFEEEREYRLAFPVIGGTTFEGHPIKFRSAGTLIKPYVEVDFSSVDLDEVRYGPTTNPALTERWLGLALEGSGYRRTVVRASGVPMR